MTVLSIITEAQGLTRQTGGVTTANLLLWISRINRTYCRKQNWPELRVLNATLTTAANTAAYDLPAAFSRIMGKFVLYDPSTVTNGYTGGTLVPFVNEGGPEQDSAIAGYTALGSGVPCVAYRRAKSGTPATAQMVFAPFPTDASKTVVYSYYADPANFTATSDSIPVASLGDTITMALCKQISLYLSKTEEAALYVAMERENYKAALTTLLSQ